MPYYRSRRFRKRRRIRVMRRSLPDKLKIKAKYRFNNTDQIVSNAAYQFNCALNLMDAGKLAAYQALYRTYRITAVKFTFIPRYSGYDYNQAVANAGAPVNFGGQIILCYTPVRDSRAAPGSYADAIVADDTQTIRLVRKVSKYERYPVVIDNIDVGDITFVPSPRLDIINSAGYPHWAAVAWAESEGTGNPPFTVLVTMYVTLYDSRF